VGDNDSIARAVVMAVHLVNTLLLTATLVLVAWGSLRPRSLEWIGNHKVTSFVLLALVSMLALSMTGAITALGDTLYPVASNETAFARISSDQSTTAHFLRRMRILHPVLAIVVSVVLIALCSWASTLSDRVRPWASATIAWVIAQVALGVLSILLSAPLWLQVLHLAGANLLWLSLILMSATLLTKPSAA
jgi:heme a synthase